MTLGQVIKKYRDDNKISMDTLAERSGVSKGYISMLENEKNPNSNKPIAPKLATIIKLADGMGIDLEKLIPMLDENQEVRIVGNKKHIDDELSQSDIHLLEITHTINEIGKQKVIDYAEDLSHNPAYMNENLHLAKAAQKRDPNEPSYEED